MGFIIKNMSLHKEWHLSLISHYAYGELCFQHITVTNSLRWITGAEAATSAASSLLNIPPVLRGTRHWLCQLGSVQMLSPFPVAIPERCFHRLCRSNCMPKETKCQEEWRSWEGSWGTSSWGFFQGLSVAWGLVNPVPCKSILTNFEMS